MEWVSLYGKYFLKIGISLKTMASHPASAVTSSLIVGTMALTSVQQALLLLGLFFILDFATGTTASYFNKKKLEKEDPSLKEESFFSSSKAKLSAVKAFTYASSIIGIWGIEKIFFIKSFTFNSFSDKDLTVTTIFVGFCCSIEFYSVVFENCKAMGFDISKKFVNVVKNIKKLISEVKE